VLLEAVLQPQPILQLLPLDPRIKGCAIESAFFVLADQMSEAQPNLPRLGNRCSTTRKSTLSAEPEVLVGTI